MSRIHMPKILDNIMQRFRRRASKVNGIAMGYKHHRVTLYIEWKGRHVRDDPIVLLQCREIFFGPQTLRAVYNTHD